MPISKDSISQMEVSIKLTKREYKYTKEYKIEVINFKFEEAIFVSESQRWGKGLRVSVFLVMESESHCEDTAANTTVSF